MVWDEKRRSYRECDKDKLRDIKRDGGGKYGWIKKGRA